MEKRRGFIRKMAITSAGFTLGANAFSAKSYSNIIGANEKIHAAIIGLNGRGGSMAKTFVQQKNVDVACVCDVDARTIPKVIKAIKDANQVNIPRSEEDCRKVLADKSIDAIYIATPDHWHAPSQSWVARQANMFM